MPPAGNARALHPANVPLDHSCLPVLRTVDFQQRIERSEHEATAMQRHVAVTQVVGTSVGQVPALPVPVYFTFATAGRCCQTLMRRPIAGFFPDILPNFTVLGKKVPFLTEKVGKLE